MELADFREARKLMITRLGKFTKLLRKGAAPEVMAFAFVLVEQAAYWCYGKAVNEAVLAAHSRRSSGASCRIDHANLRSLRRAAIILRKRIVIRCEPRDIAEQFLLIESLALLFFGKEVLDFRLLEHVQFARLQHGRCPGCGLSVNHVHEELWLCDRCTTIAQDQAAVDGEAILHAVAQG
jgi:ribosomal protein S27AE